MVMVLVFLSLSLVYDYRTRHCIETPHLCRMDAEEDLDNLVGVICAGHILEGAHILDLTQLPTFAAHGPGSRDGN